MRTQCLGLVCLIGSIVLASGEAAGEERTLACGETLEGRIENWEGDIYLIELLGGEELCILLDARLDGKWLVGEITSPSGLQCITGIHNSVHPLSVKIPEEAGVYVLRVYPRTATHGFDYSVELGCEHCPPQGSLHFSFDGPTVVTGAPGETVRFEVICQVEGRNVQAEDVWISGWYFGVSIQGCDIVDMTRRGTVAANVTDTPPGLFDTGNYYMDWTDPRRSENEGHEGIVNAMHLSFVSRDSRLDASQGPHSLLRLEVEAVVPVDDCAPAVFSYHDGLAGFRGQPVRNAVSAGPADGGLSSYLVSWGHLSIPICETRFRRGDGNDDGAVDISDAMQSVMYLFLGADEPPCLDAADANDDGDIDLADPITILNDFFRSGTSIPAPGPFACGCDPTEDALDCAFYPPCE